MCGCGPDRVSPWRVRRVLRRLGGAFRDLLHPSRVCRARSKRSRQLRTRPRPLDPSKHQPTHHVRHPKLVDGAVASAVPRGASHPRPSRASHPRQRMRRLSVLVLLQLLHHCPDGHGSASVHTWRVLVRAPQHHPCLPRRVRQHVGVNLSVMRMNAPGQVSCL
ncbi:hypothetical protein H257_02461 [Aphanomyces astaci]|uniref:Uncharacterized protein n=1 Tax=Aphanomyces astaci TaxID=112090 RepID=W4H473_APHAT|nr:hypothetical protein H257_02461 [Aphanomyces astaci]ETV85948.1 hypothetical protein H257_02461 [Aphanomyces astaci]|eukprot:XP_009824420.1 hypothetical protein H257_02461 [Aphanomyces astaci]